MSKRTEVENYVYKIMNSLDPSKHNYNLYKEMFAKMDDKMFNQWMCDIRDKKTKLYVTVANMEIFLNINDVLDTAKLINLELEEQIKVWDNALGRYYTTPYKYTILKVPVRRLKQYLLSKMSVPDSDKRINPSTGQVVKPDAAASVSMTEAQTLASKGFYQMLTEFLTVRGGNVEAYASYKAALENLGSVSLKELNLDNTTVRSVKVARAYMEAMHLENNL